MTTKHLILFEQHKKYLLHCLSHLPQPYTSQDPNRLTLAYFVISGLDILQSLHTIDKQKIIDWIYSMQVLPDKDDPGLFFLLNLNLFSFPFAEFN
jgi:geranylgeranyl transferase type-1 subunit beta